MSAADDDLPAYLSRYYGWAYLHPNAVRFFDRRWVLNLILLGNYGRLRDAALDAMGGLVDQRVLQIACVYGDLTPCLAARLEGSSSLDVVDVARIQLDNLQRKLPGDLPVRLRRENACRLGFSDGHFDKTPRRCCFSCSMSNPKRCVGLRWPRQYG